MNAMTNAMKEAGVKLPSIKYRIWHWLKDHPEKTTEDIQKGLGLNFAPYLYLVQMERAGVLKVYSDVSRKESFPGVHPKIKRYSVVNIEKYEAPPRKPHTKKHIPVAKEREFNQKMKAVTPLPYVNPHALAAQKQEADARLLQSVGAAPKVELTEAEKFAAYLEFKALMKEMGK